MGRARKRSRGSGSREKLELRSSAASSTGEAVSQQERLLAWSSIQQLLGKM